MKEAAFNGKYRQAKEIGSSILATSPQYHDAAVMLSRVYMWDNQYDSAQTVIQSVLAKSPGYPDAIEADYDLAFFSGNMQKVVQMGDSLVAANPQRIEFKEKLALAHLALAHNDIALAAAKEILLADPANKVALGILDQLNPKPKTKPTEILINYAFDHFLEPYIRWWHLYTAGLVKHYQWGSLTGKLNAGHLGGHPDTELQAEVESNFDLTPRSYMMLLYAYSPGDYFPRHRAAAEIWHKLPYKMIVSLGGNVYYWDKSYYTATASLEKYTGNYWFCLRSYFQFKEIGVTSSYYFTARRYLNDDDYFQATVGIGAAPDEPFDIKTDWARQNAYSLRFAYLKRLNARTQLRAGLGFAYEEITSGYRNRYDGSLGLIYSIGK